MKDSLFPLSKRLRALESLHAKAFFRGISAPVFSPANFSVLDGSRIGDALRRIEEAIPDALEELSKRSWYLGGSAHARLPLDIKRLLADGNWPKVEELMIEELRRNRETIIEEACRAYPLRQEYLQDALWAHDESKYTLSVPVFLSQADGISFEILGKSFFRSSSNAPIRKVLEENKDSQFSKNWLSVLNTRGAINGTSEVDYLNRHRVLHGNDLNYHSEKKSLQAISFLSYVLFVREILEEESEESEI